MSLKKRVFRSNMMILFTALISFMLIILGVLVLFEDSLERQLHSISQNLSLIHILKIIKK